MANPLATVQQLVLPPTDVRAELQADARRTVPTPLRFALARPVRVTPETDGTWEQLADGRLWRLRLLSTGATDINLGFPSYWLPPGATLYLVSERTGFYQGPYTSEHNAEHGQLWTAVVPGEAAVVELFVPAGAGGQPKLVLGQVNTGYRDVFHVKDGSAVAKAETCEIDVVCPQAQPWTNEVRSVARISIGGTEWCTATLIMDAAGDLQPFLLTANHCDITPANAASVVAYWNYQSPVCGMHGLGGSLAQNTSGSSFCAARSDIDFTLIKLTTTPHSSYGVYYAGWDRSGIPPLSGVCIHHPNSDGKCISLTSNPFTTIDKCITIGDPGANTHWQITWSGQGVTEYGSSGSGIWDAKTHKLVGTLSGGTSDCTAPYSWDCYGKFALAWDTGTSSADRLKDWLDPGNTGIISQPGSYPTRAPLVVAADSSLVAEVCLPTNGVIDPGETVVVNFGLINLGSSPTTNLVATLLPGSGVTAPSGQQSYGILAVGGAAVSRMFAFTANGNCGATITPTFQLQDGTNNLGTTSFNFTLGTPAIGLTQNFDTTDAFTLPAGWTESSPGTWYVASGVFDSPSNAVYTWDPPFVNDRQLYSPTFAVAGANSQVTFRHNYDTELASDGCVLEISIGGAPFADIIAAGGSFVTGGYDSTIQIGYSSPVAGRPAWSGTSGGFITTTVNLPPSAAGQNVRLSWRLGSDYKAASGAGWYVDSIAVANGYNCCTGSPALPMLGSLSYAPGQFQFTVTGTPGYRYAVEASTNLSTWVPLQTNSSPFTYIQANPSAFAHRYYRAVYRP